MRRNLSGSPEVASVSRPEPSVAGATLPTWRATAGCRIDDRQLGTRHPLDEGHEEGEMGATQDQGVGAAIEDRGQARLHLVGRLEAGDLGSLHQLDPTRTGSGQHRRPEPHAAR